MIIIGFELLKTPKIKNLFNGSLSTWCPMLCFGSLKYTYHFILKQKPISTNLRRKKWVNGKITIYFHSNCFHNMKEKRAASSSNFICSISKAKPILFTLFVVKYLFSQGHGNKDK